MKFLRLAAVLAALSAAFIAVWPNAWSTASAQEHAPGTPAPDLVGANRWLNSPPLSLEKLRGKVVLVEFWARECINCIHVLPHTKALYEKYGKDGLVVVGVHTPEYDEERDARSLQAALNEFSITWPVAVDNDSRIWNAYGNRYWPAIYLIDRDGRIVYSHFGEGDYEDTEKRVQVLLGEPS
ncbi:redoxin domain-containing protein [Dyella humicola]|uniref:redoxin domain-containing protein n=1 Tax=Dyella humicola TaxID=2992126 RepID=UPI002251904B|nr:redoxin domain-containing protein [Dyella humicola]